MTQPSPADELRAAAEVLREHLDHVPPGPWWGDDIDEVQSEAGQVARATHAPHPTSRYIALMGPDVGHALAKLLDRQSRVAREVQDHLGAEFQDGALDQNVHDALAVARAINGSQS